LLKKPSTSTLPSPNPVDAKALHIVNGIQKFYAQAQDFTAKFEQIYTYKIYGRKKKSQGQVFFKKPGKMRWDYKSPTPRLFIADGQTLWVYEPEAAQVFKRNLNSAQLPVALRFMKGEGKLTDDFDVVKMEQEGQSYRLTLNPKDGGNQEYKQLQVLVSQSQFEVQESVLVDPVGNTNQIKFKDVKVNQKLPDQGFIFTPPQGVRVIGSQTLNP
jgi:chaperone LolA